jgi:hypothetical protein
MCPSSISIEEECLNVNAGGLIVFIADKKSSGIRKESIPKEGPL